MTKSCPECEAVLTRAHAECPNCGTALAQETRQCAGCGEEIAADAEACPACGRRREATACAAHPEREALAECVVCGTPVCEECNHGPRPLHLCPEHKEVHVIEGWAQVYTTSNDIQAELISENLRAEGIDARVLSQKDHFSFTVDIGDLSPVRVLVPAFAYTDARDIIRDHMDERGEVTFACPECGVAYETGQDTCDECGAALY